MITLSKKSKRYINLSCLIEKTDPDPTKISRIILFTLHNHIKVTKGSRPLRGGGGKGLATKKKNFFAASPRIARK